MLKILAYDIHTNFGPVGTTRHFKLPCGLTVSLVSANGQTEEGADPVKTHFTGHWEVTDYLTFYNDYQIGIGWWAEQNTVIILRLLAHTAKASATWKRNTANENYTFAAMAGAVPTPDMKRILKAGAFPVRQEMEMVAGLYLAEYSAWHRLDLNGHVDLPIWKANAAETDMTMIADHGLIAPVHADHAFYARADRYADARWDNAEITARVQAHALEYFAELKGKLEDDAHLDDADRHRHFKLLNIVKQ